MRKECDGPLPPPRGNKFFFSSFSFGTTVRSPPARLWRGSAKLLPISQNAPTTLERSSSVFFFFGHAVRHSLKYFFSSPDLMRNRRSALSGCGKETEEGDVFTSLFPFFFPERRGEEISFFPPVTDETPLSPRVRRFSLSPFFLSFCRN